ncbi:hypothetical protein [Amycolatopsis sp. NPDC102389]|uniref:hypothetical protein n=1 Tax=Amycolatopsis sp. NPDC102389 TaxID=3363941 RepID=UPI0037F53AEF
MSRNRWNIAECPDLVAHLAAERYADAQEQAAEDAGALLLGSLLVAGVVFVATQVLCGGWVPFTVLLAGLAGLYAVWGLANVVSLFSRGRPLLTSENFPEAPPAHECVTDETETR